MSSRFLKGVLLLVITVALLPASARQTNHPKLGINVASLGKLTSAIPFTDIFKSSRGWFTSCEYDWRASQPIDPGCSRKKSLNTGEQALLDLDGDGWVRSLPPQQDPAIYTSVTSTWKLPRAFPTGRYVILYEGEGLIKMTGDLKIINEFNGHIEFDLLSPKRNLRLQILQTDPRRNGNYIRKLSIVPKRNEHNYKRQIFNIDYLRKVRDMHALRFMPWTNPRGNVAKEWWQRATIGAAHYTGPNGVPAERMVDLANAINATPWLSVPYKANDAYMRQYARMVKNRLRKDQKVYIEYSNEVWNSIFPAATYAARKADKLWNFPYKKVAPGKRRVLLGANWYAKRSVEMCQIFKKEFGGQRNRVKCVLGSLNSVPWIGKEILECPLWKEANGCGNRVDGYGIGPYFGDYIARKENRATVKAWTRDGDGGKSRLFQEILHGGMIKNGPEGGAMSRLRDQIYSNKKLADKYGLELLAYEAGQHLIRYDPPHTVKDPAVLNLFMSAQNDPRMRQAYKQYLNTWQQGGGGLLLHFYGIGEVEPKNFFGMLDSLDQKTSPKYAALMDYLSTRSTYVAPRRKAYLPPVVDNLPDPVIDEPTAKPVKQAVVHNQPAVQAPVKTKPTSAAANLVTSISGRSVRRWKKTGNSATSPAVRIRNGKSYLRFYWHYLNADGNPHDYFRLYAVDAKGGRKLLFEQPAGDIRQVGNTDQLYEEDVSRYIGPAIRLHIEVNPGLQVAVTKITF